VLKVPKKKSQLSTKLINKLVFGYITVNSPLKSQISNESLLYIGAFPFKLKISFIKSHS